MTVVQLRLVRVLESFQEPSAATNPYITQLHAALAATPGLEVHCWTWRTALLGRYDVFHTHWPDALIERRGILSTTGRRTLFALILFRLWATHKAVVRTVHNLRLPRDISRIERLLLTITDRLASTLIVLNELTPVPQGSDNVLIEHGHYRDWFAKYAKPSTVRGRVTFIGKVRRYKNVEGLVQAFSDLRNNDFSLHVAGRATSEDLAATLHVAAAKDQRITLCLRFIDDAELVREIGESELVVLPYHEMHNSGSVLAALSLDRPVLVPDNEFNRALADEVGDRWVIMFRDKLTADSIVKAIEEVRLTEPGARPDLSRRGWSDTGVRHLAAFHSAVDSTSKRRFRNIAR